MNVKCFLICTKKCLKSVFFFVVLMIILGVVIICNCNEPQVLNGDWAYKLSYDYEIWKVNSGKIAFGKRSEYSLSNTNTGNIIKFFEFDNYVLLYSDISCLDNNNHNKKNYSYFVVDMKNDDFSKPLKFGDFNKRTKQIGVQEPIKWIITDEAPTGAVYN